MFLFGKKKKKRDNEKLRKKKKRNQNLAGLTLMYKKTNTK